MSKKSFTSYIMVSVLISAFCTARSAEPTRSNSRTANRPITVKKNEKTLTISCGDDKILSYFHAVHHVPEGVDPLFRRSGFIHPLYSPAGHVLTRIQPPDHYHHYGIWNPWTKTHIAGREVDFWNLRKGEGTVRFSGLESMRSGDHQGRFRVRQEHVDLKAPEGPRTAIEEMWDVRASAETIDDQKVWVVDLTSTFTNVLNINIELDQYRYGGGLAFRATEQWNKDNCTVLTSEGKPRNQADGTRARWCNVNGQTGNKGETSGVLFMSHPHNREHPEPMRVWPENSVGGRGELFFEFCPIRLKNWTLEPNKEHKLQYRMVVYDGNLKPETIETIWNDYVK